MYSWLLIRPVGSNWICKYRLDSLAAGATGSRKMQNA
jgi:hypothetical protein